MNKISYGTPAQVASLLSSIKTNVDEEPDDMYADDGVRKAAYALIQSLHDRLDSAVATHYTPASTFRP